MLTEETKDNSVDWMTALLVSPIFQSFPPTKLQKILMSFEAVDFKKDDVIIEQGNEGDYYYLIKNGQCLCTRKSSVNAKEIKLRQLTTGDTFGEDALLSGEPRDLTITALTDVSLLRLDKQSFVSLIKEPSLIFVNFLEMQQAMKQGATLIDVRTPDEYKKHHLDGSINEPFFSLRMQLKTLNREKPFIVVCSDGRISEAAAFLLRKNKFEVTILQGGMASVIPQSKNDSDLTDTNNETTVGSPENHHDDDQLTNT
jgi:rhodanese-related sulfurtransferase